MSLSQVLFFPLVVALGFSRRMRSGSARKVAPIVPARYHPGPMTRTTRNLTLLTFAVALIGLLLVLATNLQRIEFRPGEVNLDRPAGVETSGATSGTGSPDAVGYALFLRILFIAALVALAVIVVGAIFKKSMRVYLLMFVGFVALILGLQYCAARAPEAEPREQEASGLAELLESQPGDPAAEPPSSPPPGWSLPAVAIGISIGVTLLLAVVLAKLAPRWRARREDEGKTELEELVNTVGAAADEILLGGDPQSAVLRCYREMVRVLCRHRPIDHVHMTARELADALDRAGFTADHIDRLTGIFELVRYGNRNDKTLAERAIACLDAIRETYAT